METKKFYGGLWLVKEKKNDKSPTLTGSIEIDGKKFNLAVWKQADRTAKKPDYTVCLSEPEIKPAEVKPEPKIEAQEELN